MDLHYGPDDINETLVAMMEDCRNFQFENAADIAAAVAAYPKRDDGTGGLGTAGHDFWLTRNGDGAGFWDGDLPDDLGERLTNAAARFGEATLYVGDDGRTYH